MKKEIKKTKKHSTKWTLFLVPALTLSAVAGAIYYVVKNSRTIQKEFWSVEKFNEEVKKIEIKKQIVGSLQAKNLLSDFKSRKNLAQKRIDEFNEKYKEIIEKKPGSLTIEEKNIIKNKPEPFNPDLFLKNKIETLLDFEKIKFLDFKFLDVEEIPNDSFNLRIHFEVFLNYEYAKGVFELNKVKSTPNSKYYFKSSQVVRFLSNNLKTYQGTEFSKMWPENKKEAEAIVRKYDAKSKELENQVLSFEERQKTIEAKEAKTQEKLNELQEIKRNIVSLKEQIKAVFKSENFQQEIFTWFEKILIATDAFQDIYSKEKFNIKPFIENSNNQYVSWNPKKGLNELTIKYLFINKENEEIKSEGEIKIFTLDV